MTDSNNSNYIVVSDVEVSSGKGLKQVTGRGVPKIYPSMVEYFKKGYIGNVKIYDGPFAIYIFRLYCHASDEDCCYRYEEANCYFCRVCDAKDEKLCVVGALYKGSIEDDIARLKEKCKNMQKEVD